MVLTNYEDNQLTDVIAVCDCGCSAIAFKLMDDTVFASVYGLKFNDEQRLWRLTDAIKTIGKKITGKREIYIADIILSSDDVKKLISCLDEFSFTEDDGSFYSNDSHLELHPIEFDNTLEAWEIMVKYDGSLWSVLRNKTYRGYEIAFKKEEFKLFISYLRNRMRVFV